jgi:hypothetical protein
VPPLGVKTLNGQTRLPWSWSNVSRGRFERRTTGRSTPLVSLRQPRQGSSLARSAFGKAGASACLGARSVRCSETVTGGPFAGLRRTDVVSFGSSRRRGGT